MRRSINALALGLWLALGLVAGASAQTPSPQCVASALAGGTVNAITIPALPCTGTSALVLVTAAGANTGAVTLQQIGQPALAVTKLGGEALAAGDIPVAGAVMLLQATGQQWVLLNPGTTGGVGVVPTVAALRALTAGAASAVVTQGYNSAGDGGGATYQWASGSSCTDDLVTCIRPNSAPVTGRWLGVFPSGAVNLYQAGLVPSSSTAGDASGLMNAIWTAGLSVYVPPGEWHIKNQLLCKAALRLEGAGQFASIITIGAATNDFNLAASSVLQAGTYGNNGCQIDGVKLQFYQPSFSGMSIANIVHYPVAIDGGNSTASGNWIYGGSIGTGSPVQITNAWTCVSLNNTQALGEGAWHLGNVNCSDYAGGLTLGGVISTIWVANWDEETFGMTSDQALVYESQGESGAALAAQVGRCDGCSFGTFATFAHGFKQLDSGATRGPATDITGVNVGVLELDGDGATLINGGGYVRVGALYGTNSSADTAGKIKSNPGAGLYAYTTVGTIGVTDGAPSGDISTSGAGTTVLTLGTGWYESLTANSGSSPWNFAGSNVTVVVGGINYIDPGGETVPQIVANCTCTVKFAGTSFTVPNSNRSAAVVSQAGAGTNLVMQGVSFTPGTSTGNVIAVGSDNVGNFLGSISAHGWTVSLAGATNGVYWLNGSVNNLTVSGPLISNGVYTQSNTTDSTSSATGAINDAGGLGVLGHVSIGPTTADWTNPSWIYGPAYGQNPNDARLAVLGEGSAGDNPAILGAVHTLGGHSGIGVVAFGLNDDTVNNNPVYGLYATSIIAAGVGGGVGGASAFSEIEAITYAATTPLSSATVSTFEPNLASVSIWAACGGGISPGNGTTTGNCSAAYTVVNNTRYYEAGLMFEPGSLDTGRGVGGGGIAIEGARGMDFRWINSTGGVDADIYGNASGLNVTSPVVLPTVSGPSLTVGTGSLGISGILISNGVGSLNFFQATDGTHEMIAGVDGGSGAIKLGSLSNHTVSIVANNSTVISVFGDGGVTVGSPTGGDKGAGTINVAGGLYLNGTAYTNP